jgi:glycosyltransferase involved in cell wall biosynthesis
MTTIPTGTAVPADLPYAVIVLSHLGWDWVWQRPQHLLSRIAQRHPVLFIMEAHITPDAGAPHFRWEQRGPNLTLAWPEFSPAQAEAAGGPYELIGQMIDTQVLAGQGPLPPDRQADPVFWLYTPMAVPVLRGHDTAIVVFDAMDELSAFRFAPPELTAREAALMQRADLVFTGGPSLYEARRARHPHVYCFPSGVEQAHFAAACDPALPEAASLAGVPHPRIGYYGVIDERTDLDLLRAVAALRPTYQWIMVGPTAKVDPADLPQAANLHYPGKQEYADLPRFLKGFDVCMMPFARNESTRFISPTKTLEYMAADKPIVSTPITDVVAAYPHIVAIAATPQEFVAAVDAALAEDPARRAARIAAAHEVLARNEWDQIAATMLQLIYTAYSARPGAHPAEPAALATLALQLIPSQAAAPPAV